MRRKSIAMALCATVVCAGLGAAQLSSFASEAETGTNIQAEKEDSDLTSAFSTISTTDEVDPSTDTFSYSSVADVAENAMPSIVAITNKSVEEVEGWFRGQVFQYESESAGSGIIVGQNDDELLICTNNHVVEDATELTVTFIDEESYPGQVKGTDPSNDLAVVAVNLDDISSDTMDQIKIAQAGDSDDLRVGEQVVAIGNALGYGQSVTTGIVSALDRDIEVSDNYGTVTYEGLIQTDAAINPGNSGGALLNMNGELIGINSAKASSSGVEGMGYAIPTSKAEPILENLMSMKTRDKVDEDEAAYLGITGESVSSEVTELYNIPAGVLVGDVVADGPADEAGLQKGDIITAFDGVTITSMEDLQNRLQYYSGGETVDMTIQTAAGGAYTEKTVSITLGLKSDYMQN